MTLLYAGPPDQRDVWEKALLSIQPDLALRFWPDHGDEGDITMLLVARDIPGDLSIFPNLQAIQTLWAGVDRLLQDPRMPNHLPLARMTDSDLAAGMGEFMLYHALDYLRSGPILRTQQAQGLWKMPQHRLARDVTIGIMGLGTMGLCAIHYLRPIGFQLCGWARGEKSLESVATFSGASGLNPFLAASDVVVCLLPLTDQTRHILGKQFFAGMKNGAWLIHAGRGEHLVEAALLSALAQDRPARAVLDVFAQEPLPTTHSFWHHPQIFISPHCAAVTPPGAGARLIVENYRRVMSNLPLVNLVNKNQQY